MNTGSKEGNWRPLQIRQDRFVLPVRVEHLRFANAGYTAGIVPGCRFVNQRDAFDDPALVDKARPMAATCTSLAKEWETDASQGLGNGVEGQSQLLAARTILMLMLMTFKRQLRASKMRSVMFRDADGFVRDLVSDVLSRMEYPATWIHDDSAFNKRLCYNVLE